MLKKIPNEIKETLFDALMVFIKLVGVIGILLLAYGFLISLDKQFNQDIEPYEQNVEKADYSPYSGWTYE